MPAPSLLKRTSPEPWRSLIAAIFTGNDPVEGAFLRESWSSVLLPGGLVLDDDHMSAFAETVRGEGDESVLACAILPGFAFGDCYEVPLVEAAFEELLTETELGQMDTAVFSRSGLWGLYATPDMFGVFGATSALMAKFVALAGGPQELEKRFRLLMEENAIGSGPRGR